MKLRLIASTSNCGVTRWYVAKQVRFLFWRFWIIIKPGTKSSSSFYEYDEAKKFYNDRIDYYTKSIIIVLEEHDTCNNQRSARGSEVSPTIPKE